MIKLSRIFILCGLVAIFLSCGKTSDEGVKNPDANVDLVENAGDKLVAQPSSEQIIEPRVNFDVTPLLSHEKSIVENFPRSSNELAFDLYKKFDPRQPNVTFSPLSISAALAMTYAGSKDETEKALKNVLHFGDNTPEFHKAYGDFTLLLANKNRSEHETTIEIANVLWLQKDFTVLENFKGLLVDAYKAQPISLDFKAQPEQSTQTINKTIASQTHGEIPNLIKDPLPADTRLVLTNALYFKSKWQSPFDAEETHEGQFTTTQGAPAMVNFMKQIDKFSYGEDDQKQFLLMPYKDQEFATLFVLPREGKFDDVEASLNESNFRAMLNGLSREKVNLKLPKFAQRTVPNVKKALVDLGMNIAFDSTNANFRAINNDANQPSLYIEDIVHEAVVKMYEDGTTAAAATAVIAVPGAMAPSPTPPERIINFHAERPFLFFIVHQPSGSILFMGRIDEPGNENL